MITQNLIDGRESAEGSDFLQSSDPSARAKLPERFAVATDAEVDRAVDTAYAAAQTFRASTGAQRAQLLRGIADAVEALGEELVHRAVSESGLPAGRITGERGRTCGQLRAFATLVEEGSWVRATIDEAMPERKPFPRADLRKVLTATGPVAVFTASNFPLAFSTAGGDTAAALAAGCPVIVKAHPSHLGTNALVAGAIRDAVAAAGLPAGVFSSVQGSNDVGGRLVRHPRLTAVAFTGSLAGGTALTKLAAAREIPIPVYAEMGSVNPVFLLPQKLATDGPSLAAALAGSVCLGVGQFCTNPGLLVCERGEAAAAFQEVFAKALQEQATGTMLNEGISEAFRQNRQRATDKPAVQLHYAAETEEGQWAGEPALASVSGADFLADAELQDEVFGPYTLLVECDGADEVLAVAKALHGQLTATVHGTDEELAAAGALCDALTEKAGRVLFGGVPTGVEVCAAMHHGGPFPAATSARDTSVGVDAIYRFVRPVCYQNAPAALLPEALRDGNPLGILRRVNGQYVRG